MTRRRSIARSSTTCCARELGFEGVILADALEMKGVSARHDPADAAVLALEAGCDALIVGHDLGEEATERVVAALAARVDPERLADAAAPRRRRLPVATPDGQRASIASTSPAPPDGRWWSTATSRSSGRRRIVELRPSRTSRPARPSTSAPARSSARAARCPMADVYVVHDVHRHPWMRAADRPGAVIVETGLPVWRPAARRAATSSTFGGGSRSLAAAVGAECA